MQRFVERKMTRDIDAALSKYLSPQVYASIFSGRQHVEIASSRKKLTVMFSDIVGFTTATDTKNVRRPGRCER